MGKDGQTVPSASHVLIFKRTTLLVTTVIGMDRMNVKAFIPQPSANVELEFRLH